MCVNVPLKVLLPPTRALVFYHMFGDFIFQGEGWGTRIYKGTLNHNNLQGERGRYLEHLRLKFAANNSITMMIETVHIASFVKGTCIFF